MELIITPVFHNGFKIGEFDNNIKQDEEGKYVKLRINNENTFADVIEFSGLVKTKQGKKKKNVFLLFEFNQAILSEETIRSYYNSLNEIVKGINNSKSKIHITIFPVPSDKTDFSLLYAEDFNNEQLDSAIELLKEFVKECENGGVVITTETEKYIKKLNDFLTLKNFKK